MKEGQRGEEEGPLPKEKEEERAKKNTTTARRPGAATPVQEAAIGALAPARAAKRKRLATNVKRKLETIVPVDDSSDEEEISRVRCYECKTTFLPDDHEVYRCHHCPPTYHRACLCPYIKAQIENEDTDINGLDFNCDYSLLLSDLSDQGQTGEKGEIEFIIVSCYKPINPVVLLGKSCFH